MTTVFASRNIGVAEIQIVIGDIAEQPDMDAVVNSASSKLLSGSGVSAAIFRAAGVELANACGGIAPISVSDAVITPGFLLPNCYIVHCCGPQYKKDSDPQGKLASCYRNTLEIASQNKITALAIPAISTGAYGFPIEEATQICITTIKEESPAFGSLKLIRFVVRDEAIAKVYEHHLLQTVPLPDKAVRVAFDAQQFTLEQFQRIRNGFIGDQDNKWFEYFEEPWLYIYRGSRWVGQCWWFLKFEPSGDGYKMVEAWVDDESLKWSREKYSQFIYQVIDTYLPGGSRNDEPNRIIMDEIASYCVLRRGDVDLVLNSSSISLADMKELGMRLIVLADSLAQSSGR
jgi:O-acetyl-ADP-ribose deacetylase (regulator of RNase III)